MAKRNPFLSRSGEVLVGELRGIYMAERRREAFRSAHGREPVFTSEIPKPGETDDFVKAYRLVDVRVAYADFDREVREALLELSSGRAPKDKP